MRIVECVPNFSEGRDLEKIKLITDAMSAISDVSLLDVDPGADTNRTVVTIVGNPDSVIEAAFQGIKMASQVLDMRTHRGEHARMGATDVCPFVPVRDVTMDDCIQFSHQLAKRVGDELGISVYMYEHSASTPKRSNLATVRAGEYEGMAQKLKLSEWKPDYGPDELNATAGVTAIGAREFLIAYNVNLNTQSKSIATDIALDLREMGRNKRDLKTNKFIRDENGVPIKRPGKLKDVKAVGWYIDEYSVAQISMNLVNYNVTPVHIAFEETRIEARKRGVRVTGSELVGLIPLNAMLDAGKYYLKKQKRSSGIPESDLIHIAVKSLGLDELSPFNAQEKIIEYRIGNRFGELSNLSIVDFSDETSRESAAPGGGSVSAAAGVMGSALSAMVANLTFGKKKWEPLYDDMCRISVDSQSIKDLLLTLIDEDTQAFNKVMDAFRLPAKSEKEKTDKEKAIETANKYATEIPFKVLKTCSQILPLAFEAAEKGNPNSVSDAGVAGEMAHAGAHGAALNVKINLKGIGDPKFVEKMNLETETILENVNKDLIKLRKLVSGKLISE